MKLALFAAAAVALAGPAAGQIRTEGALVYDQAPPAPPALMADLLRYQGARSATFQDWLDDGSILILTRFAQTTQVHRVVSPGADRTQLTFFGEPVTVARGQPRSRRYLYYRDAGGDEYFQGYLRGLDGAEVRVTEPGTRNESFFFSADGQTLVWARLSPGRPDYDIMVMDPARPESRRVALQGQGAMRPLDVSSDGRRALIGRTISSSVHQRWVLELATGKMTQLLATTPEISFTGGQFTPDGESVIVATDVGQDLRRLVRIDLATGRLTELTPGLTWNVEAFDIAPDGRRLAYAVNEDGYSRVVVRSLDGSAAPAQPALPKGVLTALKFSPTGERLAIGLSTPTSAGDVWTWAFSTQRLDRWTSSELGDIDPARLAEPDLVRVRSFDGLPIPAFVYRPKASTGRTPVFISIHGGPEQQERPDFSPMYQYLVGELGVAVIAPNVRGSSGYGRRYLRLDDGMKREDAVKDLGAILDWIATQPDLDRERVVVFGESYGGYMSLAALAHYSDRLAGAIDGVGIANYVTFLQNTEGYRRNQRRAEYGDERDPKMRAFLERISPANQTARMTKPLLVIQGANDPRVPKSESEQIVSKLRAQGGEAWYLLAKDEGHGFRKKQNQDAQLATISLFLRRVFRLDAQ